jgi:hypothetical protein
MVARAFTAHQLDSLIDRLSVFIAQYQPLVVTIQRITDLLSDTDIDPEESLQLLIRWQNTLRQLANAHNIIILVTTGQPKAPFSTVLHQNMDEVVQYDKQGLDVQISLLWQNQHIHYRPVPRHQMVLDEFVEGKYG